MSVIGKVIKADVLLHVAKVVAAGLALGIAIKGLKTGLSDDDSH